ncbi:NAD(P)H-quinone oxidoreductase [Pseudomonas kermanshahensis]|uniref:NAD(P)H-quinone oxidoreductase n=1 Tax=Pseudomonas kermanshahensis TaxID=2745482 RepID=A0ABU8R9B0_9PSED|nr:MULTISPECIES: NAD(P)H-quinone oxidoreductase [unclassified Pseudomonas]ATP43741.1 NAD(P)H-quinone oxidoreductase [Pseudomonas putida]MBC3489240.1 NAD(P)H-quinone oxidoreductase [Pseudomonas sp. SWRI50]SMF13227.1 putative NAD(P)H quinone oxidoreductase, PIG3 family [Pseudomonas sp. LAIL14HWK12:I11]SMR74941.1 putative NAD(P)H quinone oxidoreductase, PIG3 family [Pseudomonas sp. LAIL14HWK12:I10]SOD02358.1 putative NAD(P)H quinone oxidoreductase, PIG3 family [Pseudomonas sp. LAIL14HWK12:I8]
MKALQGEDGHVEWVEAERPALDAGQVRIRVAAAGLNRADLLQMKGLYPPPPGASPYMGLECAGIIEEVGPGADWRVGERVCALLASGAMAEEVVVDARHVLPVPEGLSLHEAAALPEVYATAWLNIFQLGAVKAGEKVLVHAGASGVGSAAIQLCKAFGNPVYVSVGSQDRLAYCEALGAAGGVVRNENLDALEGVGPFDVILDPVGASYGELNLKLLARDGRWVIIGLMGGRKFELDLAQVLGKRLEITGSTLRNRDDGFKAELLRELLQQVWPLFAEGRLSAQLVDTYPVEFAQAAYAELETNQVSGKLVMVIDPSLV